MYIVYFVQQHIVYMYAERNIVRVFSVTKADNLVSHSATRIHICAYGDIAIYRILGSKFVCKFANVLSTTWCVTLAATTPKLYIAYKSPPFTSYDVIQQYLRATYVWQMVSSSLHLLQFKQSESTPVFSWMWGQQHVMCYCDNREHGVQHEFTNWYLPHIHFSLAYNLTENPILFNSLWIPKRFGYINRGSDKSYIQGKEGFSIARYWFAFECILSSANHIIERSLLHFQINISVSYVL